jgi:phosphatidylglycerol:prolipoprotein diacylglycerol transferase
LDFPFYVHVGPVALHPHAVFETLAYSLAFALFRWRRRRLGDVVDRRARAWILGAAAVGGLLGSRILGLLEDPRQFRHWSDPAYVAGAKTVVGGFIGGLAAVEWIKPRLGVGVGTGDQLVMPLLLGIMVGRIGCFLSGLTDHGYGTPTNVPWAMDFGDGTLRHPTQLYEIAFAACLVPLLAIASRRLTTTGACFTLFMVGYMTFRLLVDLLKPGVPIGGLSAIQWACVATLAYYAPRARVALAEVRHG